MYSQFQAPQDVLRKILLGGESAPNLDNYRVHETVTSLINLISITGSSRDAYYKSINDVKGFYFVNLILSILSEDVLSNSSSEVRIDIESKLYKKDVEDLFADFNIPDLVADIIEEFLLYGEYSLRTETEEGKGITDIQDIYEPQNVVAIYSGRLPQAFFIRDKNGGDFRFTGNKEITHFTYNSNKLRVNLAQFTRSSSEYEKVLGKLGNPIVRIGKSVIWPVLDKIKEIMVKEKANLLKDLDGMNRPTLVGVSIPNMTDSKDIIKICKQYETYLNKSSNTGKGDDPLAILSDIAQNSARVKVVPSFSGKGDISKLSINDEMKTDTNKLAELQDQREAALSCLGIPVELAFRDGDSKRSNLKRYSRYARKVKHAQYALSRGLTALAIKHVAIKHNNPNISESDIKISFYNPTNIDEIDDLEGTELVLSAVSTLLRTLTDIKETINTLEGDPEDKTDKPQDWFDKDELLRIVKQQLKDSGSRAFNVIKVADREPQEEAL